MSDEIVLQAMRFQALVGILPHELTTTQPIEIDLTVSVSRGDVVNTLVELHHRDGVAGLGHQARNIVEELILRRSTAGIIEEVERPFVMTGIVGQHVEAGPTEVRLKPHMVEEFKKGVMVAQTPEPR